MGNELKSGVPSEEFAKNLGECGLTGVTDFRPGTAPGAADGAALAQGLVDAGKLTAYQAAAILERRFGDLVMGNYEILDRLGAGGMGTVFKARHRRMKRIVALKVLSPEVAREEAFAQRFQREVEMIARLAHQNIVMAYDADEAERGPFLVMEFVNGRDLASDVHTGGPLSAADAVGCVLQAAHGLACAHDQGIVHRDIKPANIKRDAAGVIKVADLGLARISANGSVANTSLTQAGGIVGTMDYMPPEQALDSTTIDHRADIYSLGCTLYFLLTGQPPYQAGTVVALLFKHRDAPIPSLRDLRPELPAELDAVFRRMVAKSPGDRYPTMSAVIAALEELQRTVALSDVRPGVSGAGGAEAGATVALASAEAAAARDTSCVPIAPIAGPVPSAAEAVAGRVVVLAEPSRTQAGIIRRYLQQLGVASVHSTGSGREAIELAKREHADVLVSSMHLADMTGIELAHALLADPACGRVGFVLATSETESEDGATLPEGPRTVLMVKPFDAARLAAALTAVIGRGG
jgi:CheY-like chemotaxis protein